jgi:phosphate/sulfate permease
MTDPILKLQILARSEMALFRLQASRNATRTVLIIIALLFALLALAMLNFAGYQWLSETKSPAIAALLMAVVNGVLALIVVGVSRSAGPNEEQEKMVRDIRDLAYNELSADFDEVKAGITKVTDDVSRIRSGFSAFTGGSNNLANNLAPILSLLIGAIKKSRNK